MKNAIKEIEHTIYWFFKHKRDNKRASGALKIIEGYTGKTNSKLIKLANEYAVEVLGSKMYAPRLYVYAALQNKFVKGWIPDNYYKKQVATKTKGDYAAVSDRNFMTPLLFNEFKPLDLGWENLWTESQLAST